MGRPGKHWVEKKWVELTPTRLFSQQFYVKKFSSKLPCSFTRKKFKAAKTGACEKKGFGGKQHKER